MKRGRVYKITNTQDEEEFFVGSTTVSLGRCWRYHKRDQRNTDIAIRMREDLSLWTIECLEEDIEREHLMERHLFWTHKLLPSLTGEEVDEDDYFMKEGTSEENSWLSYFSL